MKKANTRFIIFSLLPALLCLLLLFCYPVARTAVMSLFRLSSFSDGLSAWEYIGLENYLHIFGDYTFGQSMSNLLKIWLIGGAGTFAFALLYAVILSSGIRRMAFWRAAIFLPNTISAVALANMWIQYVFNSRFGLLHNVFSALGLKGLAAIQWTNPVYLFGSMLFSYCFASVGYYMLIFQAGMDKIPRDLYEYASLEGAGKAKCFFKITLPLIRGVFRTCVMLWTIGCVNFFTWSLMFSKTASPATVVPAVTMYNLIFGPDSSAGGMVDIGAGASVGVVLTFLVVAAYALMNAVFPEKEMEY